MRTRASVRANRAREFEEISDGVWREVVPHNTPFAMGYWIIREGRNAYRVYHARLVDRGRDSRGVSPARRGSANTDGAFASYQNARSAVEMDAKTLDKFSRGK